MKESLLFLSIRSFSVIFREWFLLYRWSSCQPASWGPDTKTCSDSNGNKSCFWLELNQVRDEELRTTSTQEDWPLSQRQWWPQGEGPGGSLLKNCYHPRTPLVWIQCFEYHDQFRQSVPIFLTLKHFSKIKEKNSWIMIPQNSTCGGSCCKNAFILSKVIKKPVLLWTGFTPSECGANLVEQRDMGV